jgi:hypothetical protein
MERASALFGIFCCHNSSKNQPIARNFLVTTLPPYAAVGPCGRAAIVKRNPDGQDIVRIVAERCVHEADKGLHGSAGASQQDQGQGDLSGDERAVGAATVDASGNFARSRLHDLVDLRPESCSAGQSPKRMPVASAMPTLIRCSSKEPPTEPATQRSHLSPRDSMYHLKHSVSFHEIVRLGGLVPSDQTNRKLSRTGGNWCEIGLGRTESWNSRRPAHAKPCVRQTDYSAMCQVPHP